MKKIKVLQFPIGNNKGGITQYALKNWEYINKELFQFDFATLSKKLDFEKELIASGARVYYITKYAEDDLQSFRREVEKVLSDGYDVIHLHTSYWKSFEVEKIALKMGIPKIIVHSHNTSVIGNDMRDEIIACHEKLKDKFNTVLATDYWACSNSAADWLFGENIPKEKICIMNNAIEIDKFSYNKEVRNKIRDRYNLHESIILGHVGRFAYQKNHEFLIDLFSAVLEKIDNIKLVLIGVGPERKKIEKKLCDYGIIDNVVFMGKIENVHEVLQAMDVFLLPSRFEGLPIVLVEAQTAGLKSIASTNITEEVELVGNCIRLPLDIKMWKDEILNYQQGYRRKDVRSEITEKGYNIQQQIKVVEEMYRK